MAEIHNENNNAPNANAPNNNEIVDNIDQNQETPTFSTHTSTTQQITPNDDRPHLFTILWTFVRAFFQSLIPETPNAI